MIKFLVLLLFLSAPAVTAVHTLVSAVVSNRSTAEAASYACTLESLWRDPPANAHFSPAVSVAHNGEFSLWEENVTASEGMKLLAEVSAEFMVLCPATPLDAASNHNFSLPFFFSRPVIRRH